LNRVVFSLHSVRFRLTLWNVGIMALVLVVLGTAFRVRLEYVGIAEVDRTLSNAAHSMGEIQGRPPPPPNDSRFRPPPGDQGFGPPPGAPPFASGFPPPQFQQHRPRRRNDGPFGAYSPRFFDLKGNRLFVPPEEAGKGLGLWDSASFDASLQGQEVFTTIYTGAKPLRVISDPIRRDGQVVGVVQLTTSLASLWQELDRLTRTLFTLIPLALLIAGLGGAFLTDRALRPVRALGQAAGMIEASDLSRRLPITGGDEFAVLASRFNSMLARLEEAFLSLEAAYRQQQQFTADASHELRTPLTVIKANTSLALLKDGTAEEYRRALVAADSGVDRTIRLVQDLLLLARADAGQGPPCRETVSLTIVLTETVELVRAAQGMRRPNIKLSLPDDDCYLDGDADALRRLFANLLENALRHTPPEGTITMSTHQNDTTVTVFVVDNGEGIAPKHLPHLFDRFYRADTARSGATGGTGLGLAICRSIAEAHGGTITLESRVGVGTTVQVTLPLAM